jgi:hypothetical protein
MSKGQVEGKNMTVSWIGWVHWVNGWWQDNHEKGNRKGKVNDLRCQMPWLCWELLFSMLCMLCMNKGSSLNLDLMISGNYVMIMIMLMLYIYICMYVCMS